MAAASSSSGLRRKYAVFINFRGEDTRRGFVSHLYKALRQKPINTFIDSEELRKGDRLSSELLTAIRESRLSIVVFSQNYADSTWCLKELVEILDCHHTKNQIVVPIFYEVDPSDIRKRKRSFAEAFAKHDNDSSAETEEVRSWRSALTTAASISGWNSLNYKDDAELIEKIVEDVFGKVIHISSTSSKDNGLVGMDSHMHEMHLRLQLDPPGVELDDVRVVGIWGMGGLGKTTIARAVYNEISCRFEACCFLENVKEGFMKHDKLHMQTQLLLSISNDKVGSSDISKNGFQVMLNSLGQRKVLIVLDDVDKLEQIEALLGEQHSFGGGSRIIITTRDAQLLSLADAKYKPKILSEPRALELFRLHAFRKKQPTRDYDDLSSRAVNYAQGLPLALKVLGAFLYDKTVREWEDVFEKLKEAPQRGIIDVLRTSYDGLDHKEKNIFLDIACFFKGQGKDFATEILDSCGFNPHAGIRVLIDRALITVSMYGKLEMHDLLEEMAQEIVRQESIKEPGRRSRLWSYKDVHHVLTKNTATEVVESIILKSPNPYEVCINAEAFVPMTQLRLLKIDYYNGKCHLSRHLKFHFCELRCLSWRGFPLTSLPSNFQFQNLVDLNMQSSLIERLWEGTKTLEKLKFIDLGFCRNLKETPDFTKVPNLEKLILQGCISLVEVHPSINNLTRLSFLNLQDCEELKNLPSSIRMKSLETLDLSGCSSLEIFPEISEVMEKLSKLYLTGSKIKELPSLINNLTGLSVLSLRDSKELKSLPSIICMKSLETLDLSGCLSLEQFPEISEVMENLWKLELTGSKIKQLPSSINNLTGLRVLGLRNSKELKSLPSSICVKSLETLNLSGCSSLEQFPEISKVMEKLRNLDLSGSKIKELPSSINNLTGLSFLGLRDCKELKSLPSSICVKSLETLDLFGCSSLEQFPEISEVMEKLSKLFLTGSKIKELPSSIHNLTGLSFLSLRDSKELKSLPSSICMKSLETLDLFGCSSLEQFPKISEVMEKLWKLDLTGSKIKQLPLSINNLTGLRVLGLRNSKELKSLPSSICVKSLETLDLSGCSSLEQFPEISEVMEKLRNLDLSGSKIKELPSSINNLTGLSFLGLRDCKELKSLPSSICVKSLETLDLSGCSSLEQFPEISEVMEKLRNLDLSGSKIKELPSSINNLTGLRVLGLRDCKELKSLPSSICVKYLETLDLFGCSSLEQFPEISEVMEKLSKLFLTGSKIKELPSSIHNLTGLSFLSLRDSKELKSLPSSICMKSLETLDLSGCSSLEQFPEISEVMEKLSTLFLTGSKIKELPSSINNLTGLRVLGLRNSKELKSLPSSICVKSLETLDLSGCSSLEQFPEISEVMEKLRNLDLSGSKIKELPSSINNLTGLSFLGLRDCKELKSLPSSICVKSLETLDLSGCSSLEQFPEISEVMEKLRNLDLSGSKIKELPSSINNLTGLRVLGLRDCKELKSLPSSICVKYLETLDLFGCSSLEQFPEISEVMEKLSKLFLTGSKIKELPSSIHNLTGLSFLSLRDSKELKSLPSSICMKSLETLDLSGCSSLEQFPEISEVMEKLSTLFLTGSKIKELPSSINNLTGLRVLGLRNSKELKSLPSSICVKSLETLDLSGCSSLEQFPEISEVMEKLRNLDLSGSKIKELPSSINNLTGLSFLGLRDCKELKSLPSSICVKSLETLDLSGCSSLEQFPEISEVMEKLRNLDLSGSKIKELPSSINNLTGLRVLGLRDCKELKSLPSSICVKYLETLDLFGCSSLEQFPEISEVMEKLSKLFLTGSKIKELPSSIHNLTGLSFLSLRDSKELKSLPSSICMKSLETLDLSGCSSLEQFPEISEVMEKLSTLFLTGSKIKELPSSINNLTGLRVLGLRNSKELKSLPSSICVKSLETLDLSGCSSLEQFPEISEVMEKLRNLDLSGSKIKELPSSINNLTSLSFLGLRDCKELKSLPSSICVKSLKTLDLSGCSSLEQFPEISEVMEKLRNLDLFGSKIKELPSSINNLTGLRVLGLRDCKELKSLPSSICVKSLETLDLFGCLSLEQFPEISEVMEKLSTLFLTGSKIKELTSSINNLTGLRVLGLRDSKELKSLPSSICVKSLETLDLSGCSSLEQFPEISEVMEKLRNLDLSGSKIKELPSSINNLTGLRVLGLRHSKELKSLPSSICVKSLETLDLFGCSSFEQFPEISEVMEKLSKLDLTGSKIKELPLSVNNLTGLSFLGLRDCKELKSLPSSICMKSLETLDLFGCSSLEQFPEILEVMEKLSKLDLTGSKIKELPSSINNLTGLSFLGLRDSKELKGLPSSICMKSLETLDLFGCSSLEQFPEISEVMEKLLKLDLSGSKIKELPSSINNLTGLSFLGLRDCKELKSLPSSICVKSLGTLDLFGCSSLEQFPEISEVMEKLSKLFLTGSKIKELPSSIHNLTGLSFLGLRDSKELKSLPSSICMKSLETLDLSGCSSLEQFPEISEVMEKLLKLRLTGSKIKELPSSINNLTGLSFLGLRDSKELKSLPSSIRMKSLEILDFFGCSSLEQFLEISEVMEKLSVLDLTGSKIKELPSSINNLTGLRFLHLKDCKEVKSLPNMTPMKLLNTLDLSGCSSLELFPEVLEVMEELSCLNLSGSNIKELPLSINNLTRLSYLKLKDCKELTSLPNSICQLQFLRKITLSGCTKFEVFPSIEENMEGLRELHLDGTSIKELSPCIELLQGLVLLNLRNCESLVHLPNTLCNLVHLKALNLCGCPNLSQLPLNLEDLGCLWDNAVDFDNGLTF